MAYTINKVGVIGSGTMGAGIAALLVGAGIPVIVLDLPLPDSKPGDPNRNNIVKGNIKRLHKSKPPQLFEQDDLNLFTIGNVEDDLELLKDCDWIIEVIVEKLEPKQQLMERLEEISRPSAIISSNTSGLSINEMTAGRSDDFQRRFLGTHFFNPPRHLKLLEIIPHENTDPALIDFMVEFGTNKLGKGCVICKDTPNFIANRFISINGSMATNYAVDHAYTVEEIDAIAGPLIGRPKSAIFRLKDVIGVDVMAHVDANLYEAIPDDNWREVLHHEGAEKAFKFLLDNNYLGAKTGQGFFKTVVDDDGNKQFWHLDLQMLVYRAPEKPSFESVDKHREIEDTRERIKCLIGEGDRAAEYLWHLHAGQFAYASQKLGEITDDLVSIDNAHKWGFKHELGPFEIWDAIGVKESISRMESDGYPVADWVKDMVASGRKTFYQYDDDGIVRGYYDPQQRDYIPLKADKTW